MGKRKAKKRYSLRKKDYFASERGLIRSMSKYFLEVDRTLSETSTEYCDFKRDFKLQLLKD